MTEPTRYGRAQGVSRKEDLRFLTGRGAYTDDLAVPGVAHAAIVRSPRAKARIAGIDTAPARAAPGVIGVFTGADLLASGVHPIPHVPGFVGEDGKPARSPARYPLTPDAARFVGDAVAAVVAETAEQARDAAELVAVDYEPLDAVPDLRAALAPGATLADEATGTNVAAYHTIGDADRVAEAFARAAHVARVDLVNNRLVPNPIEPRVCIGMFDAGTGRFTVRIQSQTGQSSRNSIAAILGVAPEQVRVVVSDIGGGFGMKTFIYPEDALVAWLARACGRPVKWRADRSESFLADTHGRDQRVNAELALDNGGRFLALRVRLAANMGAYLAFIGPVVPLRVGLRVSTGVYDIPLFRFEGRAVLTNTAPVCAYRGAGRPEAIYVIERLVDVAARELGIDPVELRRRNFVPTTAMPYKNAVGETYDVGHFDEVLTEALVLADWGGFEARRAESRSRGKLRGRGLASYVEWTGGEMTERAVVEVHGNGRVTLLSGTQNMGQGLETSYAQLVADALGIDYDLVDVVQGDTDRILGLGSVASRSLFVGGSAALNGSKDAIEKGRALAADELETAPRDIEYETGRFRIAGTDRGIGLFDLAARQPDARFVGEAKVTFSMPSWPNGCYACEVEIDPDTGEVRIDRFGGVDDAGKRINPTIVEGQVHGGLAQGIGQALLEACRYDAASGQLLTGTFQDYAMPRADDFPAFVLGAYEKAPATGNPLGAKGVGEIGAVGAPPAVVNAVVDALSEFGVRHLDMPIRAEDVWRIVQRGTRAD
ncbi:MAG: xanthine dehydrogenase family protein molybdopterin-binding subunit [Burkholderiales bacterium]|nr:xanthine dehydrogenase family protein molybdopterin-binding subunit [Burkholderiales bacterium]